ncbi:MAG: hypothetical protein DRP22_01920 [Verrucomicrobia bacterium]|nr:MAG: hypothetical protein DRP22_01920 [Verrucomicrobiota bacterium]
MMSFPKDRQALQCARSPVWWLYNLLFPVVFIFLLPRFVVRMVRRGGYRRHFWQRITLYDRSTRRKLTRESAFRVWIHAVSVGEIFVALRFMEEIRRKKPDASFVVTTTTSTGRAVAEKQLRDEDIILYFPLDRPCLMKGLLRLVRPSLVLLVECEMWPNLLRYCTLSGIPVVLVNGRISDHSYRNYCRVRFMTRRLLPMVDLLCVQGETDRERLLSLGASPERTLVVGSAKYEVPAGGEEVFQVVERVLSRVGFRGRTLLVGGSTWPGEEEALVRVYRKLRPAYPDLRLILVPRHVERTGEITALLASHGVRYALRSAVESESGADDYDVLLADTTGELRGFYRWADIVFVGKSLTQRGGQNFIEPAQFGRPVITGPNLQNFPVVARDFLDAQALLVITDEQELSEAIEKLLRDPALREEYGRKALNVVREKQGAVRRTLEQIRSRLSLEL